MPLLSCLHCTSFSNSNFQSSMLESSTLFLDILETSPRPQEEWHPDSSSTKAMMCLLLPLILFRLIGFGWMTQLHLNASSWYRAWLWHAMNGLKSACYLPHFCPNSIKSSEHLLRQTQGSSMSTFVWKSSPVSLFFFFWCSTCSKQLQPDWYLSIHLTEEPYCPCFH